MDKTPGRALLAAGGAATALAMTLAGCAGSSTSGGGTPVSGGTATFAEQPAITPDYIFPFANSNYYGYRNFGQFQYLMYRPLIWIGNGQQVAFNPNLSLINMPQWDRSGKVITLTLKPYKWSNGESVTASDIQFWMNMEKADKTNWGDYMPGYFPDNVTSYKVVNPATFQLTTDKAYNHNWFLFNELSQIIPMPKAWDRTASGPSDCTGNLADCNAVYTYLDSQARNVATYVGSPIWSIVDGPWKLKSMTSDGPVSMVPNKSYSGSPKPRLAQFTEDPFTSEAAEYNVLNSGGPPGSGSTWDTSRSATSRRGRPTTGSAPTRCPGTSSLPGISGRLTTSRSTWPTRRWARSSSSSTSGRRCSTWRIRRRSCRARRATTALATGPVPSFPANPYESPGEKQGDPFPYNPGKASQLLSSHGWKVTPNGVTTCQNPGLCGPGIKAGEPLSFSLIYGNGLTWVEEGMRQLQANASRVGIKLTLQGQSFHQIVKTAAANCKVVPGANCSAWQIAN